jgi:DTW domain-containing protein YfiP
LAAAAFTKVCRKFAWSRIEGHDDLQSLCQVPGCYRTAGTPFCMWSL